MLAAPRCAEEAPRLRTVDKSLVACHRAEELGDSPVAGGAAGEPTL
jgi:hypothetical protein